MNQAVLQLHSARRRLSRAFTLVEVLVVVALLAILATLVAPSLANANATAPLPQTIVSTLEIDMRRASIEAIGRLTPVAVVVSADRNGWWVAELQDPSTPIPGTARVLGNGSLGPFGGYTLEATVEGNELPVGNAVLCEFNTVGARTASPVTVQLRPPESKSGSPTTQDTGTVWRLEPERTRFEDDAG
ncbi:MAG: hypothetical protein RLY21_1162 [Planctomycetota bacterium]